MKIGKAAELGAVKAAQFAFPFLVERDSAAPGDAIFADLVGRRADVEACRQDDTIHNDMLAVRDDAVLGNALRSEEHTSELQSRMRISYAVFCLKKKNQQN